jgi:hypothetical protein
MRISWVSVLCLTFGCSSSTTVGPTSLDASALGDLGVPTEPRDLSVASPDLSSSPDLADPAGPWPAAELTVYGAAEGLSGPILDASPDAAQNLWAISADTLYLLRPGEGTFHRYTAADGLHIGGFTDPYGGAATTWLTAMAGGGAGEVFVGYQGYETPGDPYEDTEVQKELGNADKITLGSDGTIAITRYLFHCDYQYYSCWEDRSPRRMIYAHDGTALGHLFIGFNHGVAHVWNDTFGDHVHPEVTYHTATGGTIEKIGEFYGLALTPAGDLWMAGAYAVGLQPWNPTPHFAWVDGHFIYAFTTFTDDHSLDTPDGYRENQRGAAVTPDGRLWLASVTGGLSSWMPQGPSYATIQRWPSAPAALLDLAADPDGTLWMIDSSGQLWRFDPAANLAAKVAGAPGARRVIVDTTVRPRTVYVSTSLGLAAIRAK